MHIHLTQKSEDAHKNVKDLDDCTTGAKPQQIHSVRIQKEGPQEDSLIF